MSFICFTDDKLALRFDEVTGVRQLGQSDIDPRTGMFRGGIPEGSVTEVITRRGTYYTSMKFDDFIALLNDLAMATEMRS